MPFLPPNQQRQSTEGISSETTENWNFLSMEEGGLSNTGDQFWTWLCSRRVCREESIHVYINELRSGVLGLWIMNEMADTRHFITWL